MIPRNVIDNLRCSFCNNRLSVFPIYTYGDKNTISCGRCPKQDEFLPQREILYEELAQHIEFSCQYESNGCIEKLKPADLQTHESCCIHKPCFCPIVPLGECKWQGNHDELFEHYSDAHPALTFENCQIEIDIATSNDENYVFRQKDVTFIAQLKCDLPNEKFYCKVISCESESVAKKFSYGACFTTGDTRHSCDNHDVEFTELNFSVTANTTVVEIGDIQSKLNNPSCIICKISIIEKEAAIGKSSVLEEENEMLKALECPLCFNYMVPPIMQCNTGHSFCESHKKDLAACPTCQSSIGDTRNYLLEQITNIIEYPCKYIKAGCSYSSNAKHIRPHEENCVYGPFRCIIDCCPWESTFSYFKQHIIEYHKDSIIEINSLTYILDEDAPYEECSYIFMTRDQIFKLVFRREDETFSWSLQIVGVPENYSKYLLELDFESRTKEKIYIRKQCGPIANYTEIDEGLIVRLTIDDLKNFIVDDMLTYKVRVVEFK